MKIPRSVNILGKSCKIKVRKLVIQPGTAIPVEGYFDPALFEIWVTRNADHQFMVATLFHELFHAHCHRVGITQSPSWTLDLEEVMAESLSNFLAETFTISFNSKKKIK